MSIKSTLFTTKILNSIINYLLISTKPFVMKFLRYVDFVYICIVDYIAIIYDDIRINYLI